MRKGVRVWWAKRALARVPRRPPDRVGTALRAFAHPAILRFDSSRSERALKLHAPAAGQGEHARPGLKLLSGKHSARRRKARDPGIGVAEPRVVARDDDVEIPVHVAADPKAAPGDEIDVAARWEGIGDSEIGALAARRVQESGAHRNRRLDEDRAARLDVPAETHEQALRGGLQVLAKVAGRKQGEAARLEFAEILVGERDEELTGDEISDRRPGGPRRIGGALVAEEDEVAVGRAESEYGTVRVKELEIVQ